MFNKKSLIIGFLIACAVNFLLFSPANSENVTLTTYYPAPYGVYNQMVTKTLGVGDVDGDGNIDGADAPDPAVVNEAGDIWVAGDVGIGTTDPQAQLDVVGGVKVGRFDEICDNTKAGTIRWVNPDKELQYCDGTIWKAIVYRAPTTCIAGDELHGVAYDCYTGYGNSVTEGCKWCQCDVSAGPDQGVWDCTYYCPPNVCPAVAPW